ncbi:MAG: efflux RND transporter periplasmic adaptor subunit [Pikeienuella sp.]
MMKQICGGVAALALLAACDQEGGEEQAGGGFTPPPQAVAVIEAAPEAIPVVNELPGRIAPTRIAEVRPRVSGLVIERLFEQGAIVEAGAPLYRIDPEPFQVQVNRSEAALAVAEAGRVAAQQLADRQVELRNRNVVSAQQYDDAVAGLARANANVAVAAAELEAARINLKHTVVESPIRGRIGRARITEGALVSSADIESLATVQQLDPVYADFTQTSKALRDLRRAYAEGKVARDAQGEAAVGLLFDDGAPYGPSGRLLFSESTVDATTGQITLRGEFPNPDGDLLPGMYVRVLIQQGVAQNAIAVPQQAIQRDAGGVPHLYIVNEEGAAELRPVKTGRVAGDRWLIEEGLNPGDKVIVEGFQKIRPGAPVAPEPWDRPAAADAGGEKRDG